MEGGIWGDGVYAFSPSEKSFICFAPRRGPGFQLVIFKLINSQSRIMKSVKPGCPENVIPTLGLIKGVVSLTPKRKYTCMQAMP